MTVADLSILTVFLASMVLIGLVFARENDSVSEMFGAGGRSPWWVSGLSSYMTFFSAGAFVVWGGMAFRIGITAILINLCHGLAALLAGYFVAGRWKRLGVRTGAEFIELRFGAAALQVYTWSMLGVRVVSSGVALYALAVMLTALMPLPEGNWFREATTGHFPIALAIVLFGAIVIAYTMIGGLWAVLMTDVLQFVVILLTVMYTLVAIVAQGGGLQNALSAVPAAHLDPAQVTLPMIFFIGWTMLHFFQFGAEWAYAQRYLSVPTGQDARRGMYLFGVLYFISPVVFLAPPLIFRGIEPGANPEQAYMLAAALVLPSGMLGMVVAAMFSATASSVSAQINLYAGVLTTDMYARLRGQPSSERHLLWVGRAFTVLLGLVVIAVAIAIPHLGGAEAVVFALMGIIGPLFAPAVWGLLSPRVGNRTLWASLAVSLVVFVICEFGLTGASGWFGSSSFPASLGRWLAANPYTAEIYSAVVAPLVVLLVAEWWPGGRQRVAEGWRRLEARAAEITARADLPPVPSELPAKVVAAALAFVAALTAALVPINRDEPTGLFVATSALATLAMAAWLGTRRRGRPQDSPATVVAQLEGGDGRH